MQCILEIFAESIQHLDIFGIVQISLLFTVCPNHVRTASIAGRLEYSHCVTCGPCDGSPGTDLDWGG